jgi:hypothetical protein
MIILGTPDNLNASFEGLVLTPTNDFIGTANISISVDDQGNTGSGGSLTALGSVQVYHAPTNDAPVITLPSPLTIKEDGELVLSGGVIQVQDDAEVADLLKIEVTMTNGTINLGDSTDVIVTQDGSSGTLAFSGTITQVNTAFNVLTFIPTKDFVGDATVAITADDQGAGGQGGSMIGSNTLSIAVSGVNDAPTLNIPGVQVVDFDASLILSTATDNAITFTDVDAVDSDLLQISLQVLEGTLTLPTTTDITLSTGDGESDSILVFTATATNGHTALDGLTYTPIHSAGPSTQILITVDDLGNSGSGGVRNVAGTLDITISYKPPVITQGDSVSVTMQEDNPSTWSVPTLTATDPNSEAMTWSRHGQPGKGDARVDGTGSSPTTLTYVSNANFHGQDSFSVKVTDASGNSDIVTINVTVTAANDDPTISSEPVTTTTDLAYSYRVEASDVDGDSLVITNKTDLPSWLELIDHGNGTATLSGTYTRTAEPGSPFADATNVNVAEEGWKNSKWFGVFYEDASGWIYHTGLGWLYVADQDSSSLWFWTEKLGWIWTGTTEKHDVSLEVSDRSGGNIPHDFTIETEGIFPRLYSPEAESWLYYEETRSPTPFYNHFTGKWIRSVYSYTVNATINDSAGGTITGGGEFELGESATLTASPVTGYKFTGWSGDETSTEKSITVSSESTIQANFLKLDVGDWSDKFN